MTRAPSREPAGLPAPYRNPWLSLGEAIQAVGADSLLRLRRLWRRNGEGSLWRPGWWPETLAAGFWPLVLGLLLVLLLAIPLAFLGRSGPSPLPSPQQPTPQQPMPEQAPAEAPAAAIEPPQDPAPLRPALPAPVSDQPPSADSPLTVDSREAGSDLADGPTTAASPMAAASVPPPPPDPLESIWRSERLGPLIDAVEPDPLQACLRLRLRAAFAALPAPERLRLAQHGQSLAQELGYDHLELLDGSGRLLARDALVGGGMIMIPLPAAA